MSLKLQHRIEVIAALGAEFRNLLAGSAGPEMQEEFRQIVSDANRLNPWFTHQSTHRALEEWGKVLTLEKVRGWASAYDLSDDPTNIRVGVINAGNIPLVGLHDLLSVVLSGHSYVGKNASDDTLLLPFVSRLLFRNERALTDKIRFVPALKDVDAVIATGSNNSARYFEYYFGKYPNIIRMNRNGVAILSGTESSDELKALGDDIFTYYGLGCRNVSKMYVPRGYSFNHFFESVYDFHDLMNFNKYMNNFDYNNSILLLKQVPFLQNGFLITREEQAIPSPISIVHYEFYDSLQDLQEQLSKQTHQLQCIATSLSLDNKELNKLSVPFGKTQSPALSDYADGVDTVKFLCEL